MTEASVVPLSVRQRFREALQAFAEQHPEMSVPECARSFVAGLMEDDRDLIAELITLDAQHIVAELLRRDIHATRNSVFAGLDLPTPETQARRSSGRSGISPETLYERIEAWREYVPTLGRHENILDMNRVSLRNSADYDQQRTDRYALKMLLKRELADALHDDAQTVGEVFTAQQVREHMESVRNRLTDGKLVIRFSQSDHISLKKGT
jgi:hypothetical protein